MQRINAEVDFNFWETQFKKKIEQTQMENDPAHDLSHFYRVTSLAKTLAIQEQAQLEVVVPAAWLHDLVNIPKNDPRRKLASSLSATAACQFLKEIQYPTTYLDDIGHAIQTHSFSANLPPLTLEAKVVQDADRLDAIGAIGIARCFSVGGQLQRPLYSPVDPFAENRAANDSENSLDHFFVKLLKLVESFQTHSGRIEGERRLTSMKQFLAQLKTEIT